MTQIFYGQKPLQTHLLTIHDDGVVTKCCSKSLLDWDDILNEVGDAKVFDSNDNDISLKSLEEMWNKSVFKGCSCST